MRFYFYTHSLVDIVGHFEFSNHKLEVYHYTYNQLKPFYKNQRKKQEDFTTNQLRIAYATARTLCSYHLDKEELYFDVIASLLSHLNFITKNSSDYLQLKESRLERLRDFSKTTRIGELAQGINSIFAQERLDFPYVVDFHLFHLKVYGKVYVGTKTPDFVVINKYFTELGLLESKGEAAKDVNINGIHGKLNGALTQLKSIKKPCVTVLIPACSRFENDAVTKNHSSIHYSIIKKTCKDKTTLFRIFRMHYASWFYLIGDFDKSTLLLEEKGTIDLENDPNYILENDNKERPVYWVKRFLPLSIKDRVGQTKFGIFLDNPCYYSIFRIGIYKNVIDQLNNDNINNVIEYPVESDDMYQRFQDGTLIKVGRFEEKQQQ